MNDPNKDPNCAACNAGMDKFRRFFTNDWKHIIAVHGEPASYECPIPERIAKLIASTDPTTDPTP
jgi:hypothetical protein